MDPEEKIKALFEQLAEAISRRDLDLKKYRDEAERMKQSNLHSSEDVAHFESNIDEYEITAANHIAAIQEQIQFYKDKISGKRKVDLMRTFIDTYVEVMKDTKRADWLAQGVDEKDFDQLWEKFKFDLLKMEIFRELGISPDMPNPDEEAR